jgi:predicted permease
MTDLVRDIAYAARKLRLAPAFTITAVLTLALGIGASAAIFTLLDQISLRLLPVKDPERLVVLRWNGPWNGSNTGYAAWSYPWYEDLRDQTGETFEELFGSFGMGMAVSYEGQAEQTEVTLVTGNYFRALGLGAARGRVLGPEDDQRSGANAVAVLSYDYWRDRFGSAPDVIGKTILVNQQRLEIVGITQFGFRGLEFHTRSGVFIPSRLKDPVSTGFHKEIYQLERRRGRWLNVYGRLRDGVSIEQASAALEPVMKAGIEYDLGQPELAGMNDYGREQYRKSKIDVLPGGQGRRNVRAGLDGPLSWLMAMVGLLLLIACGNVANLLLAGAAARTKEVAVRFALGGSRWRVVRQLLAESAMIAVAAGALGLVLANWAAGFIVQFAPGGPGAVNLSTSPDLRIVGFAILISAFTAFAFGLMPALRATNVQLAPTLKDQAGAIAGGNDASRRILAGSQVFFSLLLLIAAGLFQRSLTRLHELDTGINSEQTLVFSLDPLQAGYSKEGLRAFIARLEEQLETRPEISAAGVSMVRVLSDEDWSNTVSVEGYQSAPDENMNPYFNGVSPKYFATLEIPLLEGRAFTEADVDGAPLVGIVNESFAKRFFGDDSAIGRRFGFGGSKDAGDIQIVGVIPDVYYTDLREKIPQQVFVPFAQSPWTTGANIYVRTDRLPEDLAPVVRVVSREMDANLPIVALRTVTEEIAGTLTTERLLAYLATAFGIAATLLAAVGLYGLLAYSVSRRRRELGLRMALGAQRGDVAWLILKEVVWLFAIGAGLAIPSALLLGRMLESQLFGVTPRDPLTMIVATALLAITAACAGALPALRAARTQPMSALRFE